MSAGEQVIGGSPQQSNWIEAPDGLAAAPRALPQEPAARPDVPARDRRTRGALVAADVAAVLVAIAVAGARAWLATVPAVVVLAGLHGLYDRDGLLLRKSTLDQAPQLLQVVTLTALALWLAGAPGTGRGPLVAFAALLLAGALVARGVARLVVARTLPVERCLFVGEAADYERLRGKLASRMVHAELAGRIALRGAGDPAAPAGDLVAVQQLIGETGADRIVIDPHALAPQDLLEVVAAAQDAGLRVTLLPRGLEVAGGSVSLDELDGLRAVGVRCFGLSRPARLAKRTFDIAVTVAGLLIAGPLMALIALAILADSGGPVLFRQVRVGRDGRPFRILKFRTMDPGAEARHPELRLSNGLQDGLFKLERDPRVTRVGRLLRAMSLDELPQLLNVLRGDMSLVGPRPLVLDEDAQIMGWYRRRLHLAPGMTGNWQIAGSGRVPLGEMVRIDCLYVAGWSLWLDIKILLRTVPHVLGRRGM
jgi:exopolysaccharide biosynthesis polyprenyl glycosylphosphotransferase